MLVICFSVDGSYALLLLWLQSRKPQPNKSCSGWIFPSPICNEEVSMQIYSFTLKVDSLAFSLSLLCTCLPGPSMYDLMYLQVMRGTCSSEPCPDSHTTVHDDEFCLLLLRNALLSFRRDTDAHLMPSPGHPLTSISPIEAVTPKHIVGFVRVCSFLHFVPQLLPCSYC